jgi:hypothetical protein
VKEGDRMVANRVIVRRQKTTTSGERGATVETREVRGGSVEKREVRRESSPAVIEEKKSTTTTTIQK